MKNQKEIAKISCFLDMALPIVVETVRTSLQSHGCKVKQEGRGRDLAFSIKSGEKKSKFYLQNLMLDIATVDRDEEPLRFDEKLTDFTYFRTKTARLTESKLKVLFNLLKAEDVDAAVENIARDTKRHERIRIWRFNQKNRDSQEDFLKL